MKNHTKIIFSYRDIIFQTEDVHLGGGKYKDLKYWLEDRFRFIESKRGWGDYSKKDLNRITNNINNMKKDKTEIIEKDFRIRFLFQRRDSYLKDKNMKSPKLMTLIVKAANPVIAVEKALMKAELFAYDVIKTEIGDPDKGDITDVSLSKIVLVDKGKEIKFRKVRDKLRSDIIEKFSISGETRINRKGVLDMSKAIVTVKDLSEDSGIEAKKIRVLARKLGLKPAETGIEGFGPKKKYGWEKGSKELETLIKALKEEMKEVEDAKKAVKKEKVI